MFRYSLARLMGLILVVAITLGVVRFFGPSGLIVAVCALLGSLFPVFSSRRRGLDPTIGVCAVACGALGGMFGGGFIGANLVRYGPTLICVGAFLGGIYWATAVSVLASPQSAIISEPTTQGARPSKYLMLAWLSFVLGPTISGLFYAIAMILDAVDPVEPWADLPAVMIVGLVGGSLFAVPCFLAWLLQVGRQRQRPLPPQSQPP
jgi:hypothetical protein